MGWRDVLAAQIGHVPVMVYAGLLLKMSPTHRLALARELLKGTGRAITLAETDDG